MLPLVVTYAVGWAALGAGAAARRAHVGRRGRIGKIVGALFGAEIERRRGGKGTRGAAAGVAAGVVAGAVIRRLGPLGLLAGGAYAAKKAFDRRREAKAERPADG